MSDLGDKSHFDGAGHKCPRQFTIWFDKKWSCGGVFTDGKDMAYQNQSIAFVHRAAAVHIARDVNLNQYIVSRHADSCTLKVFRVSPKREFVHFYLAFFNKYYYIFTFLKQNQSGHL